MTAKRRTEYGLGAAYIMEVNYEPRRICKEHRQDDRWPR